MAQRMKFNKAAFVVMAFVFLAGFVSLALADDSVEDFFGAKPGDFIKYRTYVGGFGISSTIDQWGNFQGTQSLQFGPVTVSGTVSNPEVDFIPAISRNFGFGALVGRREGAWALEVSYWRSDHTGNIISNGPSGPATFATPARLEAFDLDFKRYFFTQVSTQPFVSFGFSFPWLWVQQGSEIIDNNNPPNVLAINDETISGIGFNVGAGLEIYLGDGFSLVGGAFQRWTEFDQINGASKIPINKMYFDNNPADVGSLEGDGLNLYVGTTIGIE
jgi:hypothetical protein